MRFRVAGKEGSVHNQLLPPGRIIQAMRLIAMSIPRCFCGSTRNQLLIEGDYAAIPANGQAVHFRALKCQDCELVFTDPPPTSHESLYQNYYYENKPPNEYWITHYSNYRSSRLRPHLNSSTRILEIGCADGDFVERIKKLGVQESVGVELSRPTAKAGRALGRDIRDGDVQGCNFPSAYFDIVQAHHVLEHVLDLTSFLNEVHRILKPGSLFYLSLPRYNSMFVKDDPNWIGWYPQQHFWHFTEKTLARLMKEHGFKLTDIAIVRAKNYLPVESRPGLLRPAKVAVKQLINHSVRVFQLGDLIDAFFEAV
jgi:SAM-dependent methyltransferase